MEQTSVLKAAFLSATTVLMSAILIAAPAFTLAENRIVHEVTFGENVSSILARYGVKKIYGPHGGVAKVAALNADHIKSANRIYPGQKLILPLPAKEVAATEIESAVIEPSEAREPASEVDTPARNDAASEVESAPQAAQFEGYSWVDVGAGASYVSFEGRQTSNGTRAKLLSDLSPSVAINWRQQWTKNFESHVGLNLRALRLQAERSGVDIGGTSKTESAIEIGGAKDLTEALKLGINAGLMNTVFYRGKASGGLELFQTPIAYLRPHAELAVFKLQPFAFKLIGGLTYFSASSYDSAQIKSGVGFDGAVRLQQTFQRSEFGCDFGYAIRKQDTQFLEYIQQQAGLFCGLKWRL